MGCPFLVKPGLALDLRISRNLNLLISQLLIYLQLDIDDFLVKFCMLCCSLFSGVLPNTKALFLNSFK